MLDLETLAEALQPGYAVAEGVLGQLAGASLPALGVAVVLHVLKLTARARGWHNIVGAAYPEEPLGYRRLFGAYLCGIGTNAVVPARPGELLKLVLMKRQLPGASYPALASTLMAESVFDAVVGPLTLATVALLGWTAIGGSVTSPLAGVLGHPAIIGVVVVAALCALLVGWRLFGARLRRFASQARRGFAVFDHPGRYFRQVFCWQLAAWVLRVGAACSFLAAFHLGVSLQSALLVVVVQSAAGLIPLTPGGAGTQQMLLVLALGAGASTAAVLGFGIGMQLTTTLVNVVLAVVSLALLTGTLRWRRLIATSAGLAGA